MANQMENILGEAVGHLQVIPGTVAVAGKEFIYFSDDGRRTLAKQFGALTQYTNPPYAKSGGVTSQGCKLVLPDGSMFHAIAYHGDIDGWRRDIEEAAKALHQHLARIAEDRFVTTDGRSFRLAECKAIFA